MNRAKFVARLHEEFNKGLSVHGLNSIIAACTDHLRTCAKNADESLVGVFAFRGAVLRVRDIADDEGFPDASRLARIEARYWPLLKSCVSEMASPSLPPSDGEIERVLRELFSGR